MKIKLRNHLYYHWWVYVLSAVLAVALWFTIFSKLAEPKAHEQIHITYIGSSFDHMKLQGDLYDIVPERTGQEIKSISVENATIKGEYDLNTILRARAAGSCDFFVIENSVIEKYGMHLASYFPETDAAAVEKAFGGVERVTEEGKIFGLACTNEMKIASYYSGKSACGIFFNKNSANLAGLFGGKTERDAALQIIRYLTEGKDVQT